MGAVYSMLCAESTADAPGPAPAQGPAVAPEADAPPAVEGGEAEAPSS